MPVLPAPLLLKSSESSMLLNSMGFLQFLPYLISQQCLTSAFPVSQTTASAHPSLTVGSSDVSPNWPFLLSLLFWFLSFHPTFKCWLFSDLFSSLHALPSNLFWSHGFRYHLYANDYNLKCISANLRHHDCKMHWDFVYHKERQKHWQLNDAMASCHINHKIHSIFRSVRCEKCTRKY